MLKSVLVLLGLIFFSITITPVFGDIGTNSPLKQITTGIAPEDVICKSELTLMIRPSGDDVACVTPGSVSELTIRGWNGPISSNSNISDIDATAADIVFKNGAIYTVDADNPWAEAVAINGKKISFVGDNKNVQSFVSDGTKVVDLKGKMMLPGFHDSHVHPLDMGLALTRCNLFDLSDKELYLKEITKCAQEQSDEEFVIGMGFWLPDYDPNSLTKSDLDRIIPDKPAAFMDMDGHSVWVNSKMLELAEIDKDTPDPRGGVIIRDPNTGEPTGLFLDDAMFLVDFLFFEIESQESYDGATQALAMMSSGGITSFVEAMTFDGYEELFREMDSNGDLNFRVNLSLWVDPSQDNRKEQLEIIKEQYSNDKSSHVRTNMVKLFIDQGIETQTGSVFEPYYDKEGNHTENYGLLSFDQDDLVFYVTELERAGFQIHMHISGDNAIRIGLDSLEESRNTNNLSDTRNTISHVYLVHPDDVFRFAELDVVPNYQAFWAYKADGWYEEIESSLGQERAETLFPFSDLHDAGAKIVLGSDWPVTTFEPLKIIEVGLTRQNPYNDDDSASSHTILNERQRLDLETLIEAYTINGAYLMQQEEITGSVEVGKYADLVVLEKNLFEVAPSEIGEVKVIMTFFEGNQVFNGTDK